jgi:GR25 family glycosyltransferase involved in LPS biosynthesis
MKIDKVYIITLDHSAENISKLVDKLDVITVPNRTTYEIIRGVNGRELLNTNEGRVNYGIRLYDKWNIGGDQWMWNRDVSSGEAGCTCSHINIWEDVYKMGYENVLVLEDDFFTNGAFQWDSFSELDNYDWDLAYLSRLLQSQLSDALNFKIYDTEVSLESWVKPGYSYQTHAYVLNKSGAAKLVEDHLPILKNNIVTVDEFLPSTYTPHPREDIRNMYIQNINAVAYRFDSMGQTRNLSLGGSLTEPAEGVDY